jgi:predicted methyltransferase
MRKLLSTVLFVSLAATGCKKKESAPAEGKAPATEPASAGAGSGSGEGSAAPAAPSAADRVAEALKKAEADAAEELKRWDDALKQKVAALLETEHKDTKEALAAILASPHRVPSHPARDAHRHPLETLTFFGVTPESTVLELGAGGGWYTEIIAPLVAKKGKLIVAGPDANGPATEMSTVYGKRLDLFLAKSPELFGNVHRVAISPPDTLQLGDAGTVDVVIAIREMHNWQRRGLTDKYLAAVHAVLKDGGTFGVVAHRAAEGAKIEDTVEKGYLPEAWVIEQVEAAGFKLVEKSEINANPKDTKDYENGVWTLPPNFREGDKDRAKYEAIGESDRMTLKFQKVAK